MAKKQLLDQGEIVPALGIHGSTSGSFDPMGFSPRRNTRPSVSKANDKAWIVPKRP